MSIGFFSLLDCNILNFSRIRIKLGYIIDTIVGMSCTFCQAIGNYEGIDVTYNQGIHIFLENVRNYMCNL